jgi:PAS domain S-box-containing protein
MSKQLKILHVEDNPLDAELIHSRINGELNDYEIKWVSNKNDFLSGIEKENYDILLCDFNLPSFKDGFEILDLARSRSQEIPIIFVTGTIGEELAVGLLKKGATDYILKDKLIKLVPAITRAINEHNERIEKKIIQNALEESEDRFRNLFMNSPVGIYRSTPEGEVIVANPALVKILGFSSLDELKKRDLKAEGFINQDERDKFKQIMHRDGEVIGFETTWINREGKPIYILENSKAIKGNNGEVLYYEGTIEDITERILAQQELIEAKKRAEESDRLKTEFLAQMSHEVRTPLNTLTNLSKLIDDEMKDNFDDEMVSILSSTEEAGSRLIRTMELILNMATVSTGTFSLSKKDVALKTIVENIVDKQEKEIENKGLKVNVRYDLKEEKINTDEYLMDQIISNLVDNSIKYTDKGEIDVHIFNDEDKRLYIEVVDTGNGIAEEYIPNLFKPFTQESSGYSRKYEGNGLGLALTQKYVELLGGEIFVKSKKGEGSAFTVVVNL